MIDDNIRHSNLHKIINNDLERKILFKNEINLRVFYKIIITILNSIIFGLISYLALLKFRKHTLISYNNFSNQTIIILVVAVIFNDIFFSKFNKIFLISNKYELLIFLLLLIFLYILL